MKKNVTRAALAALLALGLGSAQAYTTSFGQDLNGDPLSPLDIIANSSAAEASFKSTLTGVTTETFETSATPAGASGPLALSFPGTGSSLTATLDGGNGVVTKVDAGTTDGLGRYSVPSATSSQFWEVTATDGTGGSGIADFTVTFQQDIAAFGFYGVDIGDFGGSLSIQLLDASDRVIATMAVGNNTTTLADGSVLFFGITASDASQLFRSIRFVSTAGSGPDVFAFDNFTIADACQAGVGCGTTGGGVPEPASLALVATALLGLGFGAKRRRA